MIEPSLLPALAAFECVARHASFSRAAAELGLSASALSQSVSTLERRLGLRLLARTTRHVGLTEEGARLLDGVRRGLAELGGALASVDHAREQPSGTVRITLPRLAFALYFAPHVDEFARRYPEVGIEFSLDDKLADLVADRFDIGLRMADNIAGDMVAIPLGRPQRLIVAAAPAYFARHPVPLQPADLAEHDCIRFRFPTSGRNARWLFRQDDGDFELEVRGRFTVNDADAELDLLRRGLGISQVVESMVQDDLAAGRLREVLAEYAWPMPVAHLYFPSRAQMPARLRVFIDFFRAMNAPA
ncbi:LysR family transcriptional regulator [Azoarcus olearius]|uniref:Probable transcriptional regulator, LysR family n=1 Tax=Azoarcus sp. (strain BH72) TaxID=418699 RepID=A1K1D3_AZOSB|nr:LysR family transcriptional regulator [Azoarcus olearius]ANQ83113.1 LysR family transcriptional regulator [Azoarcus olearius]CAL92638.1 probable transcriptional regulator, LysR family [Azoarcus olearius]